uniref:Acetolactate synthase small subunit n=2 Tax=Scytosiphon TaxID=27966 RepID=A0A7T8JKG1_SCYLO|nr:acetolactate synthase small subunit [Scytosiphon promiscuus]YP_010147489.1 aceohydroxyacid synthase small subunit [Scytosiphon lomentaria]QDM58391.1 acetolactate synthase small subunit [Scytosiphon promiscuus]QDM58534.1 acetolactate synthase small subunit [Scytosiphon promiscuus]QQP22302.1 aceohydroxyacid synthase small subunit [Scytosiphon lomentaria]QTW91488.1 acetolactate synthase small subunit [Scytosiphon lomentaria]WAM64629.1 acetolactate synthase small subunit [Scytosiphon lomentari
MERTISVLVEKDTGGLVRIISLLTRRRFNLKSITMSTCERKCYERITIVLINQSDGVDAGKQLTKQIRKLVNVVNVKDITYLPLVQRELVLIKLQVNLIERAEISTLAQIFRFKITDVTDSTVILEVTADQGKIAALEKMLEKYNILQLSRTGGIALIRESGVSTLSLKEYPEFDPRTGQNYLKNIEDLFQKDY